MSSIVDWDKKGDLGVSKRPQRYDIEIYQGDSFELILRFADATSAPINLTGTTANVKFAASGSGPTPPSQPTVTVTAVTGEVKITIDDTSGFSGEYVWDLQLVTGTKKRTYIGGKVTVVTDITP